MGKCFNIKVYANSSSIPNIATDLAVLVLPLRTVWGLKVSIGKRMGLLAIFMTGGVYVPVFLVCAIEQYSLTTIAGASSPPSSAPLSSPKRLPV
jgi:hypothetical protein